MTEIISRISPASSSQKNARSENNRGSVHVPAPQEVAEKFKEKLGKKISLAEFSKEDLVRASDATDKEWCTKSLHKPILLLLTGPVGTILMSLKYNHDWKQYGMKKMNQKTHLQAHVKDDTAALYRQTLLDMVMENPNMNLTPIRRKLEGSLKRVEISFQNQTLKTRCIKNLSKTLEIVKEMEKTKEETVDTRSRSHDNGVKNQNMPPRDNGGFF
jgi:hypothetical protein